MTENNALPESSLDSERRRKGSVESHKLAPRVEEVSNPRVELAFDSIGRQFGEQGRMPFIYLLAFVSVCILSQFSVFVVPYRL